MEERFLDEEEKFLMESFGDIDPKTVPLPSVSEQNDIKAAAKDFVRKETKMNIRIDPYELKKIKETANLEGLKYQTFVKSVLHKYITGQLVERRSK